MIPNDIVELYKIKLRCYYDDEIDLSFLNLELLIQEVMYTHTTSGRLTTYSYFNFLNLKGYIIYQTIPRII